MKLITCKCGLQLPEEQIRIHIALLTPRWPAQRCTSDHHDPDSVQDMQYLERKLNEA